jgi:hypothetical protein
VSACSNDPLNGNPYAAEFRAARQQTDIPEILAALDDGVITDAEYQQAVQLTINCLADHGYNAEYNGDGGIRIHSGKTTITDADREATNQDFHDCELPRKGVLDLLYWGVKENPHNLDQSASFLDCLKRFGLIGKDVTEDQYRALDPNNLPWSATDGDFAGCMADPFNYQGGHPDLTPEEAGLIGTSVSPAADPSESAAGAATGG